MTQRLQTPKELMKEYFRIGSKSSSITRVTMRIYKTTNKKKLGCPTRFTYEANLMNFAKTNEL